jgi:hypothetical protein
MGAKLTFRAGARTSSARRDLLLEQDQRHASERDHVLEPVAAPGLEGLRHGDGTGKGEAAMTGGIAVGVFAVSVSRSTRRSREVSASASSKAWVKVELATTACELVEDVGKPGFGIDAVEPGGLERGVNVPIDCANDLCKL